MQLIGLEPQVSHVGYAYQLQYGEASVLVNDIWKERVAGVPLNAFLVASSIRTKNLEDTPHAEQEVLLLRVTNEFELPNDKEMTKSLLERYKSKTTTEIKSGGDGIDPITLSDLQWGGLKCRILGTFYVNNKNQLAFGSDVENFSAASNLRVFKPMGAALEMIVNYCDPNRKKRANDEAQRMGFQMAPPDVDVGVVRYTSTQRMHERSNNANVTVKINSGDFLARRTACFGMTRTGKSNLIKTLVASVRLAAASGGVPIGQLIFDLNGEYANANAQDDGSSIADVFREDTVRYRGLATKGFKDLRNNFFNAVVPGLSILQGLLESDKLNVSADIRTFIEMSLDEPEPDAYAELNKWSLRRAIYLAMLHKAGFEAPKNFMIKFSVAREVMDQIKLSFVNKQEKEGDELSGMDDVMESEPVYPEWWRDPSEGLTPEEACEWLTLARKADQKTRSKENSGGIKNSSGNNWLDITNRSLLNLLAQRSDTDTYIRGMKVFTRFSQYHSPKGSDDVAADVYAELERGKIVILDLSVGMPSIRQDMAERIAKRLFESSMNMFTEGGDPPQMVMYVEEAHNLIGKNSELDQTWPRIAKEGAKFKIALVYATQEPSSVHPNILANTENWFVTHLNNDDEINAISKFYDFSDFGKSLKKAQDVGFARIKTLSASFVVPTQVKLFDPKAVRAQLDSLLPAKDVKVVKRKIGKDDEVSTSNAEVTVDEALRNLNNLI